MAFEQFRSPTLPVPPAEYEQSYFSSLVNNLTSFFTIMDSKAGLSVDSVIANTLQLPVGALALSNGANNNIGIPQTSFVRITGPSGVFNITGITKPSKAGNNNPDGTIIILYNTTAYAMTISHNSASSTAANRIYTNTGFDVATTGKVIVSFIYSATDSRWTLLSIVDDYNRIIEVKNYGAVGNGVTDDRAAIQNAITVADAAKMPLYIGGGTYLIDSGAGLTVPDNMSITLHPNAILLRDQDAATPLLEIGSNVHIEGGQIKQTVANSNVSAENSAIRAEDETDVWIENVQVLGQFYIGIQLDTVERGYISRCHVKGVKNRSFYPYQTCDDIHFIGCIADGRDIGGTGSATTAYGYNINSAGGGTTKNILFTNCSAKHCVSQGFAFSDLIQNCGAVGCVAENIDSGYGFLIQTANEGDADRVFLSGCKAYSCQYGFYIQDCLYASISGCVAWANSSHGIYLNKSELCTLTGCVAHGNGGSGIILVGVDNDTDRNIINGCQSTGNTAYGISINNQCNYTFYTGNYFYGNDTAAVLDNGVNSSGSNNGTS